MTSEQASDELKIARDQLSRATITDELGNVVLWDEIEPDEQLDMIEASAIGCVAQKGAVAALHAAGRPAIFKDERGIYELWPEGKRVYV